MRGAARPGGAEPAAAEPRSGRTVVRLYVRRLVLEGISPADRTRVTSAMAKRLAELVGGAPGFEASAARNLERLDGGTVSTRATPEDIGRHLATRIFGGLTR